MSGFPVKIINAHKYYNRGKDNELHVMDNVNLELPEAGMIAIFGRSGCGKTTLLNAVGGLDKIASGSIELFGQSIREDTDTLRNKYVGYIFQNYNLDVSETVFENVSAALRLCGMEDETEISERSMAALRSVEMDKYRDRTPDTLSGGQQQRVAIARALVKNPAIILADEPTGNLDEQNTVLVMDILKALSRTRLVLLVTHEAHLVDHYCDRVIEIVDGHVHSERVNEGANGYVQRNKNHIYLGEFQKTETAAPGVKLEYYGEPAEEITLQVVNVGGKLYLKSGNPAVKVLDEGSEIKLMEGVFEETPPAHEKTDRRELDMSRFAPFEGKHFGRLFHWKNSIKYAWRENFGSQKKKKGKGLLRVCLVLLAMVMVFMTAAFGASIRTYTELRRDHNENLVYIPLNPEVDYSAVRTEMGKHGMEYSAMIGYSPVHETLELNFRSAAFMTAEAVILTASARPQDITHVAEHTVVAGSKEIKSPSDVVITSALAQKLLESSTVSYLNEPIDLIGMVTASTYYAMDNIRLRIVGVVESDELFFYMDSMKLARYSLQNYFWMPVTYATDAGMSSTLKDGEIAVINNGYSNFTVGDTLKIHGMEFSVSRIVTQYTNVSQYPDFVKETYKETLITDPGVYAAEVLEHETLTDAALYEWLLDHYFTHLPAFYESVIASRPTYEEVTFEEWAIAKKKHIYAYAMNMGYDPVYVCGAYLYHNANGSYPETEELEAFMLTPEFKNGYTQMELEGSYDYSNSLFKEYDRFVQQRYEQSGKDYYEYVVSDADFVRLSCSAGPISEGLGINTYSYWSYSDGSEYYTNHLLIRSNDIAATEAFLTEQFGREAFYTPDDIFDLLFAEMRMNVIVAVISVLVVLALMCLCVYFIMRSSFMSRIREVGILRAIGVTRKNLTFRFAVETGLLILLTLVLGYILSALFIASLSDAALFSTIFYFPAWMAIGLLVVITAVSLFFGVLPAITLLRRTPSEILSKYDI